jgi:hypothetical protein
MIRDVFTLVAVLFIVPASVEAQSSVTMRGTVSETVTLSVAPNFQYSLVSSGRNTVRVTLSSDDGVIRVPLLVRSNTNFKISADFESNAVEVNQLSVTDVHATGALVSPNVVNAIEVKANVAQPLLVITGPRVSIGGTLASPNNALQITVLIHLKPQPSRGLVYLTFVGSPLR